MPTHDVRVFTDKQSRPQPRRPMLSKPKIWNHQDDLKALTGKPVPVFILNCPEVTGVLLEADQFTLKILESNSQSVVTYFKHSLTSFRAV